MQNAQLTTWRSFYSVKVVSITAAAPMPCWLPHGLTDFPMSGKSATFQSLSIRTEIEKWCQILI
jgi:hypothetical protein